MTAKAKEQASFETVEQAQVAPRPPQQETALAAGRTMTPGQLASVLIERENFDVDKLARLMELQERHEANEARKAYAAAIMQFRAACPQIIKTGHRNDGPGKTRYDYPQWDTAEEQIGPVMQQCQLSVTHRIVQDEKDWIRVEAVVTHIYGHSERTSLGGPPDTSGSKNMLQARKSTVTYLKTATAFAILGLTCQGAVDTSDDGDGGAPQEPEKSPESKRSIQDPERADKEAFVLMCRRKTGNEQLPNEIVKRIFGQVQAMSGKASAKECLEWADCDEVLIDKDGTVSAAWEQG